MGKLICYTLGKASSTERNKFKRELLGYTDFSNNGKYKYHRKGLLNQIPHHRPIRSVIIVRDKDKERIIALLDQHKAKYSTFDIKISHSLLKT